MKRIEDYGSVMRRMHPNAKCFAEAVRRAEQSGRRGISVRLGAGIAAAVTAVCVGANVLLFYRMSHFTENSPVKASSLPAEQVAQTDAGALLNAWYQDYYGRNVHSADGSPFTFSYDWGDTAQPLGLVWETEYVGVSARAVTADANVVLVLYDMTCRKIDRKNGWLHREDFPLLLCQTQSADGQADGMEALPLVSWEQTPICGTAAEGETMQFGAFYEVPVHSSDAGQPLFLCLGDTDTPHAIPMTLPAPAEPVQMEEDVLFSLVPLRYAVTGPLSMLLSSDDPAAAHQWTEDEPFKECDLPGAAMQDGSEILLVCSGSLRECRENSQKCQRVLFLFNRPVSPAETAHFYLSSQEIPVSPQPETAVLSGDDAPS